LIALVLRNRDCDRAQRTNEVTLFRRAKKRVCVVTYRHSGHLLFENSVLPRSNVNDGEFILAMARNMTAAPHPDLRADSKQPCRRKMLPAFANTKLFYRQPGKIIPLREIRHDVF
jgi:hypothetical protein